MRSRIIALMLVTAVLAVHALTAPTNAQGAPLVVRAGANHHLGDDSFVATFGRLPTAADGEKLRMRVHLRYVHDWLAARPATSPVLAPQRAQLLAYLEDYIAIGITPKNHHVLHRSPVFIDDEGAICAVGYLIERSVGRQLPELIASTHRYDFLETIAAAMPDVAAWVARSGFTLDELASIQPAYGEPTIIDWRIWNPKEDKVPDGPFEALTAGGKLSRVRGDMRKKLMEGEWNVFFAGSRSSDSAARAATKPVKIGTGMMKHGAGQWTSFDVAGHKLAEGPFVNNLADGAWRIYHASGNLAAEGKFHRGVRVGAWRFYLDTATPSVLASGSFRKDGMVGGTWKHFDATGSVVATTSYATPPQWGDKALYTDGGEGLQLTFAKTANGFEHAIHQGTIGSFDEGSYSRLETMAVPGLRLYSYRVTFGEAVTVLYDSDGNRLEHSGEPVDGEAATGPWQSSTCDWPKSMRRSAARGQLADLHGLLYREAKRRWKRAQKSNATDDASVTLAPTCTKPQLLSAADVENNYQRRADLVPNLVNTVRGAAAFEADTLLAVTEARARVTQAAATSPTTSPESFAKYQQAQDALSSSLARLSVVVERYPDLRATQNFRDLQAQLEGTENRIAVARMRFNEASQAFNAKRSSFPTVLMASLMSNRFHTKAYFAATPGAQTVPSVNFGSDK